MSLAEQFRSFADWAVDTSPLYERIAREIAEDPDLLAIAESTPPGRSPVHLLLGSVHYLLLDGADGRLREFYPSVTDDPADGDPVPAFRAFCLNNRDQIEAIIQNRRTQTNAVRRCAALFPAFGHVADLVGNRPLAIVEIGPSAGLNLLWVRYAYDYGTGRRYGAPDSPVTVDSAIRESVPPFPDDVPAVASRRGIDLNPLDVTDDRDVTWLRALIWPEHRDRDRLLRDAVALARTDPPEIVEGDAVEVLPDVVESIPRSTPVCVYDTQVLYQLDEPVRERLRETIRDLGRNRCLHWLSGVDTVPDEHGMGLVHRWVEGDELQEETPLAYEQHGRWVRWIGSEGPVDGQNAR